MGRRLLWANIVLLVGIVILSKQVVSGWQRFAQTSNLEQILSRTGTASANVGALAALQPPDAGKPLSDFTVIPERDLFAQERRPPAVANAAAEEEKPPQLAKNPTLAGVVTAGDRKQATIKVYEGTQGTQAKIRTVGVGDVVQGYSVSEITDTTMKMRWKEHELVIDMMLDSSAPKQAAATPPARAAVTVVTIGSAVAAVETTTPTEIALAEEGRGLDMATPAAQALGSGRASTAAARAGAGGMRSSARSGPGSTRASGGSVRQPTQLGQQPGQTMPGASGIVGFPRGGSQVPFTGGVRRQR